MYGKSLGLAATVLSAMTMAQSLDKPPLQDNLDNLKAPLQAALGLTNNQYDQWGAGWIPQDCMDMTNDAGLNPADISTFNVNYEDCSTAWVLCWHKDAPSDFQTLVDMFGRLPVATRQWVRHVIHLPDPNGAHAYNSGGNIAMFADVVTDDITVFVHESGHSLDLLGAYADNPLSSSQNWLDNYNQDSNVPDPYSQTNQIEDVAQNTVVDSFNLNVQGGFAGIQPNWGNIFHQYATVDTEQRNAGNLLLPGGTCTRRLENSAPVQVGGSSRIKARDAPNVALAKELEVIEAKVFHTGESCAHGFQKMRAMKEKRAAEKPNVALSEELEVIPPKDFHTGRGGGYPGKRA